MNDKSLKQLLAALGLILTTAIWGWSFVIAKNAIAQIPPMYFIFFRFSLATLILAIICGKKLTKINKDFIWGSILTGICLFGGYTFQTLGLQYTAASNASFITGLYVILVPLVGFILGNYLPRYQLFIAFIAVIGLALFSLDSNWQVNYGDVLVFIGSIAYTLHFFSINKYNSKLDAIMLTFGQIAVVALLSGVVALATQPLPPKDSFNSTLIMSIVICAVLATCLAFFLQIWAQKFLSPTQTSVILTAESIFGAFFGWLLLNELFTFRQFIGAAFLITAVLATLIVPYLINKSKKKALAKALQDCEQES